MWDRGGPCRKGSVYCFFMNSYDLMNSYNFLNAFDCEHLRDSDENPEPIHQQKGYLQECVKNLGAIYENFKEKWKYIIA